MTRTSWLKKVWKGRSKGVSTVVGTIFLMLIIFMVSANVLIWTFSRNADYNQAVMEKNEEEAERSSEKIVASEGEYSVVGDEVTVETELTNEGSVAVQIVNLWVLDTTIQRYGFNETIESLNLNLNPGDNKVVSAVVTVPGASEGDSFNSWFLTARGNMIPIEEDTVADYVEPHPWLDLGVIRFRFEYESLNFTSENYHDPLPGWIVPGLPGGEPLMFHVRIINTGQIPVTLEKHCVFYLLEYRSGQGGAAQKSYPFYIVSPDSVYPGKQASADAMYPYDEDTNPYVLQPNPEESWLGGPPVVVKFGAKETAGETSISLSTNCEYLAYIGLYYTYMEDGYERQLGQTIPFVAVRSVDPYSPPSSPPSPPTSGILYLYRSPYVPDDDCPSPGFAMGTTTPSGLYDTMTLADVSNGGTHVWFYTSPVDTDLAVPDGDYNATIWIQNLTPKDASLKYIIRYYDDIGIHDIGGLGWKSGAVNKGQPIEKREISWPGKSGFTLPAGGGFVFELYSQNSDVTLYYDGADYPSNIGIPMS